MWVSVCNVQNVFIVRIHMYRYEKSHILSNYNNFILCNFLDGPLKYIADHILNITMFIQLVKFYDYFHGAIFFLCVYGQF